MSRRLPEFIDPFHLVEKRQVLKGVISLSRMKRLASLLVDTDGIAELEIHFGRDEAGLPLVRGTLSTSVRLQCQRCLGDLKVNIDTEFTLGVVSSLNEARSLPENNEPLVVEEVPMPMADLVEDEILLALPAVAVHPEGQCVVSTRKDEANSGDSFSQSSVKERNSMYNAPPEEQAKELDETRQNPFAVLEHLKGKLNK